MYYLREDREAKKRDLRLSTMSEGAREAMMDEAADLIDGKNNDEGESGAGALSSPPNDDEEGGPTQEASKKGVTFGDETDLSGWRHKSEKHDNCLKAFFYNVPLRQLDCK